MRTIFLFIRGVDQTGRAFEKPRRDLTEMEKRQQDLARSSQRLLFGGAAFLAFAGMLAFGLAKIIEQSSRGAMMMGDLGVAIQRFISGVSEAMTKIGGPAIQGLTKWLDELSRSPFWLQVIAWASLLLVALTALAGIVSLLGWIGVKLIFPITGILLKAGAFLALKSGLLAAIGMALGGTLVGGIFYLAIPILVSIIISYIILELAPPSLLEWLHKYGPRTFYQERLPRMIGGWFGQLWRSYNEGFIQLEKRVGKGVARLGLIAWTALIVWWGTRALMLILPTIELVGGIGLAALKTQLLKILAIALGGTLVGNIFYLAIPVLVALVISYIISELAPPQFLEWLHKYGPRTFYQERLPRYIEETSKWFGQLWRSFNEGFSKGFTQFGKGFDEWIIQMGENLATGIGDIPIRLTFPITGLIIGANAFLALKTQLLDALTTALGGTVTSGILLISIPVTLALIISNIISKQIDLKNTALSETLNEVKGDIGEFEDLKRGGAGGFAQLWERIVNYISVSIDMSNSHYPPGTSPEDVADAVGKKMAEDAANLGSRPGE